MSHATKEKRRGRMLIGAKPIARKVFEDESKWRSLHSESMRRALGLFMLGGRLAGYENIIDERLNALIEEPPQP